MADTLNYDIEDPELMRIAQRLMDMGVHVVGTANDFRGGAYPGLWVCAECTPDLWSYWGKRPDICSDPRIQKYIESIGWWEWNDPGTLMIWVD
jgi:hypothetical protein